MSMESWRFQVRIRELKFSNLHLLLGVEPKQSMFDWVRISGLSSGLMKYQPSGLLMI
jgi:hypothetical protein